MKNILIIFLLVIFILSPQSLCAQNPTAEVVREAHQMHGLAQVMLALAFVLLLVAIVGGIISSFNKDKSQSVNTCSRCCGTGYIDGKKPARYNL